MCAETDGDCFDFVTKYLKIQFHTIHCLDAHSCKTDLYEATKCTPEQITQAKIDEGNLYICPPHDKANLIYAENNFDKYPSTSFGLQISPNYDLITNETIVNKEVTKF